MTISVGDKLPDSILKEKIDGDIEDVRVSDFTNGRKIVIIGVIGAFTPTCHLNHLPGFVENSDAILAKGVDEIAVIAVNDAHVTAAWAKASGGKGKLRFLSDWNGDFTKAIGLELDLSVAAMGLRSQRYSMIVEDGTVTVLNIEETHGATNTAASVLISQL